MGLSFREARPLAWSGAILSLLMVVVLMPSSAVAGCRGHYAEVQSSSDEVSSRHRLQRFLESLGADSGEAPRDRNAPCSGPSCSGNPAPVPSPPPSVPISRIGQWAILEPHVLDHDAKGTALPGEAVTRFAPAVLASILRPPRPCALTPLV